MKIYVAIIFSIAFMFCLGFRSGAQDTRVYEEKKAALEKEIEILDRQLTDTSYAVRLVTELLQRRFSNCRISNAL